MNFLITRQEERKMTGQTENKNFTQPTYYAQVQ